MPEFISLNTLYCDNIFIVKGGTLITPPADVGALEGITRGAVIELAKKVSIPFQDKMLKMEDLYDAREVFLTGTAAEIVPVTMIDKRKIGKGSPGEYTSRLMDEFKVLTKIDGVKYEV